MVSTVKPNANATPRKPIPRPGKPAASTAAPQPPSTSQNVPKNSATTRLEISLSIDVLPKLTKQILLVEKSEYNLHGNEISDPIHRPDTASGCPGSPVAGRSRRQPKSHTSAMRCRHRYARGDATR